MSGSSAKAKRYRVVMIPERCKGCGYCIEFCPKKMLDQSEEINSKGYHLVDVDEGIVCTGCDICSIVCPDFAISVVPLEETEGVKT